MQARRARLMGIARPPWLSHPMKNLCRMRFAALFLWSGKSFECFWLTKQFHGSSCPSLIFQEPSSSARARPIFQETLGVYSRGAAMYVWCRWFQDAPGPPAAAMETRSSKAKAVYLLLFSVCDVKWSRHCLHYPLLQLQMSSKWWDPRQDDTLSAAILWINHLLFQEPLCPPSQRHSKSDVQAECFIYFTQQSWPSVDVFFHLSIIKAFISLLTICQKPSVTIAAANTKETKLQAGCLRPCMISNQSWIVQEPLSRGGPMSVQDSNLKAG